MWEERAERARREIADLAAGGLDLADLYAAALAVVRRSVPFDQGCWAGVDPDTLGMTSVTNWRPWPVTDEHAARFAESEYTGQEPNTFRELLRRPQPVARISDAPHRDVVRSVRINDILLPLGLDHELRAAFRVDEACWGVGSIFREGGQDFSDREVEFLTAVTATLAAATRVAVRVQRGPRPVTDGPVIVIAGIARRAAGGHSRRDAVAGRGGGRGAWRFHHDAALRRGAGARCPFRHGPGQDARRRRQLGGAAGQPPHYGRRPGADGGHGGAGQLARRGQPPACSLRGLRP